MGFIGDSQVLLVITCSEQAASLPGLVGCFSGKNRGGAAS
jgi:hypothetical protein